MGPQVNHPVTPLWSPPPPPLPSSCFEINNNRRRGCNCGTWINHLIISVSFFFFSPAGTGSFTVTHATWPAGTCEAVMPRQEILLSVTNCHWLVGQTNEAQVGSHPPLLWHSNAGGASTQQSSAGNDHPDNISLNNQKEWEGSGVLVTAGARKISSMISRAGESTIQEVASLCHLQPLLHTQIRDTLGMLYPLQPLGVALNLLFISANYFHVRALSCTSVKLHSSERAGQIQSFIKAKQREIYV